MKQNQLLYFEQIIKENEDEYSILTKINTVMEELERIYSYAIMVQRNDEVTYIIKYAISENLKYNTLSKDVVVEGILGTIKKDKESQGKYIIGHKQPPLDLMIELYEPLIQKLSTEQKNRWRFLEYDDICQIGRLTFILLYEKGYLIHPKLLRKAFSNAILQEVKTYSHVTEYLSLESKIDGPNEDMEKLTLEDTLRDIAEDERQEEQESREISQSIFSEVKDILIDMMGIRQFEQFYRDYTNGHTTTWSRRKMQSVKQRFEQEGLTRQIFNNKHGK